MDMEDDLKMTSSIWEDESIDMGDDSIDMGYRVTLNVKALRAGPSEDEAGVGAGHREPEDAGEQVQDGGDWAQPGA